MRGISKLRKGLHEYLAVRRALGFGLKAQGRLLHNFVDFADGEKASFITTDLALRWAAQSSNAQPAYWAIRLALVRRFAEYRNATDGRTEIPPLGLLPHHFRRKSPYVYSENDLQKLVAMAKRLRSQSRECASTNVLILTAKMWI